MIQRRMIRAQRALEASRNLLDRHIAPEANHAVPLSHRIEELSIVPRLP